MNTYIECNSCGHQWMLTGDVNIKGCPKCGAAGAGRLQMGGPVPSWYKAPAVERKGFLSRLIGKQGGKEST